ncbi:unnamed protein product [Allacma fusca]|uniref:Uncharacterized protein n=1 Tax=Allacma fusca TaxID=39272 RepID=A0A8J2JIV1_9HEXA|nr:unnamed protein product [Allacma fusca]
MDFVKLEFGVENSSVTYYCNMSARQAANSFKGLKTNYGSVDDRNLQALSDQIKILNDKVEALEGTVDTVARKITSLDTHVKESHNNHHEALAAITGLNSKIGKIVDEVKCCMNLSTSEMTAALSKEAAQAIQSAMKHCRYPANSVETLDIGPGIASNEKPFLTVKHKEETLILRLSTSEMQYFELADCVRSVVSIVLKHYFSLKELHNMTLTGRGKDIKNPGSDRNQRKALPTKHLIMLYAAVRARFSIDENLKKQFPRDYQARVQTQENDVRRSVTLVLDSLRQNFNEDGTAKALKRKRVDESADITIHEEVQVLNEV